MARNKWFDGTIGKGGFIGKGGKYRRRKREVNK